MILLHRCSDCESLSSVRCDRGIGVRKVVRFGLLPRNFFATSFRVSAKIGGCDGAPKASKSFQTGGVAQAFLKT